MDKVVDKYLLIVRGPNRSRDEWKERNQEGPVFAGNGWSWIERPRRVESASELADCKHCNPEWHWRENERESERRGGEKKLFPQVVYWQIQFPDQRWMAGVVCASIESRFSSTVCIRCSLYDGYEWRACSRDRSPMNFWSIPFSVNNLNPASSKGEERRVWDGEKERKREKRTRQSLRDVVRISHFGSIVYFRPKCSSFFNSAGY